MTLTNRLSIDILSITVVVFLALGGMVYKYGTRMQERHIVLYATALEEDIADRLNYRFREVEERVCLTARLVELNIDRPDSLLAITKNMVNTDTLLVGASVALDPDVANAYGDSLNMGYVWREADGRLHAKRLGGSDYRYTQMEWYRSAMQSRYGTWSEPYFDRGGGNLLMTTFSYPLHDKAGKVCGVFTADMALGDIVSAIEKLKPIDDSYGFIIGKEGDFLAHPDSTMIMASDIYEWSDSLDCDGLADIGKAMTGREKGARRLEVNGHDILAVYAPISHTDWSVCTLISYKAITSELGSVTVFAAIILAIGLVMMILAIRATLIYAMRPMERITAAANQIAAGNFDARLPELPANDGLGRLNHAFVVMQSSLRRQMQMIEQNTRARAIMDGELSAAAKIQTGLLPGPFPQLSGPADVALHATLLPAKEVGGDFYDYFVKDDRLYFAIGDVSGKGIPAALFMAVTRTLFRMIAAGADSPAVIAESLNEALLKNNGTDTFVTMFIGIMEIPTALIHYCDAGHNPPLIISRAGSGFLDIKDKNMPVGVWEDFHYKENSLRLNPGESLLLYTDGVTEAENQAHEQFGERRMADVTGHCEKPEPKEIIERIESAVKDFCDGAEQSDDLTMLCIRWDNSPTLTIENKLGELARLRPFVSDVSKRYSIGATVADKINLVLEEALVNVINHAYREGENGLIELKADVDTEKRTVTFTVQDNGRPFDPTTAAMPDLTAAAEDRPVGGLGIYLMTGLSDSVTYERAASRNILRLTIRY